VLGVGLAPETEVATELGYASDLHLLQNWFSLSDPAMEDLANFSLQIRRIHDVLT